MLADVVGEEGRDGVEAVGVAAQDIAQRCEEEDVREEGADVPPYGLIAVVLMGYLGGDHQRYCWFLDHGDFTK